MATTKKKPATTRKAPAKKKPAASTKGRSASSRAATERADKGLEPERIRDLWGIGLIVLAVLSGLGLYAQGSAGLVGVALVNVFRGLLGVFGLAVPVLIAAGGVLLLGKPLPRNPRIVGGTAVVLLALIGLWHIASGAPGADAERAALHAAGGWVGVVMAKPLSNLAATPGAVVVLLGLLSAGLLVLTATSPRVAAMAVWTLFVSDEPTERSQRRRERKAQRAADREDDRAAREAELDDPSERDWVEEFSEEESRPAPALMDDAGVRAALDIPLDEDGEDAARERTHIDPATSDTVVMDRAVPDRAADDDAERADLLSGDEPDAPRSRPEFIDSGSPQRTGQARQLVLNPDIAYELPSLDLLRSGKAVSGNATNMESMTEALERMLEQFNVDARVVAVRRGPTVTRFEIELGTGVKVNTITKLEKDISYALATPDIRIVAPIPGKVAIGIEVPNTERDHITLGDILRSPEAAAQTHPLTAGIGLDISGRPVLINLAKMPHLLIAGATGSGKSVVMNSIVTSVIMRNSPETVRMILIDPKRVEMATYEDVPHLLTRVVTDPKRAKDALDWVVSEMERRYDLLARYGHRNIDRFNEAAAAGLLLPDGAPTPEEFAAQAVAAVAGPEDETEVLEDGDPVEEAPKGEEPLPYIMCVIDELADLMMVAPRDIEGAIVRIAQMARAVGIHLVIATQRPSVNVVTGLIKANVPSRMALSMATGHDSKTILDQHGAEKLIGQGDMLYMPANASKPHRLQGCYIDEQEIEKIVDHCKAQAEVTYAENVVKQGQEAVIADVQGDDASDADLTKAAMELVVRSGLGSTSMLQRKLKVGFARAGRLMDELEQMGVVGPSEGPKARTVLMTVDELERQGASA
ncbi:FtsK/SpoIIIE family DNA translocase [Euzebya pacifica]|uniref:FtsK/SpoIIIE family DNA translocase n=1 Tax=Euzebya pacifica TaxID=1608957 RepID=UPI0013E0E410|nr:DNA translocase FtsK [Euzebya pacifica]